MNTSQIQRINIIHTNATSDRTLIQHTISQIFDFAHNGDSASPSPERISHPVVEIWLSAFLSTYDIFKLPVSSGKQNGKEEPL